MERITGIPLELLSHSIFDEFDNILKGLMSADVLRERAREGYMILIENGGYKMILGQEAFSLANDLDEQILGEVSEKFIEGTFVSRGYAKGLARLLTSNNNIEKFKDGDVAIIENLNNKILPSLKRATAIISTSRDDNGLIAKFAREFGKPCLINAKNIFNIVRDGDLVEVRANHGTARILNKN
jgi:phosphohistidine swiveling domain-containing protein